MKIIRSLCQLGLCATLAVAAAPGTAQLTLVRPSIDAGAERPIWFAEAEGRQIGPWGLPGDYAWRIDAAGRGVLTLRSRPRIGGARPVEHGFALTPIEHVRFATLLERFVAEPQVAGFCLTDQAQDIVGWRGGPRGDGLFNFDRGCTDAANQARLALLEEAIALLRAAAQRQAAP